MTRIERLSVAAAALVAIGTPAILLGLWPQAAPRDAVTAPLLAPAPQPAVRVAYARVLFGAAEPPKVADALPADAPELAGIVGRIGTDAVALVRTADGRTRTIGVGEGVDGWTLQSLAIDAASFTRGGQSVRVPLPTGE